MNGDVYVCIQILLTPSIAVLDSTRYKYKCSSSYGRVLVGMHIETGPGKSRMSEQNFIYTFINACIIFIYI